MGSLWSCWALWAGATLLWALLTPAEASCQGIQCAPGQRCQMVSGKAKCLAESTAVCRAQGDPHYTTFDGHRYDMMGTCTYTMAELRSSKDSLLAFKVDAKNEHRSSNKVSYVRLVTVHAYNHTVSLIYGEVGLAKIDYQYSSLPVSLSEGLLRVHQSGTRGVLELDFGLVVTYDWDGQLTLSLPKRFQDQVSGLCGNYNGDPADDFLTPDGKQAPDVLNFTKSWKVNDQDLLCDDGCYGNCPSCIPSQAQLFKKDLFCGMLTLPSGPFADCHQFLDPKPFLEECVYDMCVTGGERLTLCRGLNAYAQACVDLGISVREWRSRTNCPLTCPANSHYELCSPACPPSCNSEARPTNCSSRPCVEGCVCLPGFVASRGLCMPVSSCGCIFQDRLLAPGQEVYADEKCHLRCTCDGATQKVICRNTTGCLPKEHCGVQNGSFGCFPEYFRICRASGDPHYMSLDERIFNFMGTCTYLFTASCGQHPSLPDFKVFIENERRGSQSVSFVRSVKLEALGIKLEVRREYQGKVLVDGILHYLPFQALGGKLVVFRQGKYAILRTNFSLSVSYNWDTHVTAKVPSNYFNSVCGLCGNFNGDPRDDLGKQIRAEAIDPRDFGKKWLVSSHLGCRTDEQHLCPDFNKGLVSNITQNCRIFTNISGHFKHCWRVPAYNSAYIECAYDCCRMPGQTKPLCDTLATYTAICQSSGVIVYPWRTETLCPMTCPPHSHYELCQRGCPLTCGDQPVPGGCGSDCYESCVCDEGYVLSGEACVPLASCGCVYQGIYHAPGDEFYPGPECNSLCHCDKGGLVSCQPSHCSPHEVCKVLDGILRCVGEGSATCQVSGASHYTTFDGRHFDFMGTCVHVLAQTCWTRPGLKPFTILQENAVQGNKQVSVTKKITIEVANYTLQLEQNQWKVKVNGVDMKLPVLLDEDRVQAFRHGTDMVIETKFGLLVSYDLKYSVRVKVPHNYYKHMCGLCGDYNDDPKNDFQKSDGSQAASSNELGDSWEKAVPGSSCTPRPSCKPGQACSPKCYPTLEKKYRGKEFCGLITSPTGPLAACHKLLDPQGPLQSCVFDLCLGGGNQSILCSSIHAYVSACQAAGGTVKPWRNQTFCPMECPPHSHYEVCADTCSLDCSAITTPMQCLTPCSEGCECDTDFLQSITTCVPMEKCGCHYNGVYYEPEESVLIENCQQHCVCQPGKGMMCQDHSCKPGQVCEPSGGVLTCVTKDPCQGVTCRSQETCTEKDGKGVCRANYESKCWVWGDPHYHSFDGLNTNFHGTCSYLMAGTGCPGTGAEGLTPFSVITKHESQSDPKVSYVRKVTVKTYNTSITIHEKKTGRVQVNGVFMALPVYLAGGRISVINGGSKAVLETNFGLQVTYNWKWRVHVTLPSSYYGAVCGLCGNMDKNPQNDQVFPNGTMAPSIPTWGGSWQVPGWDPLCWNECQGSCPTCPEDRVEEYRGPGFCGPLDHDTVGPFTSCHAHVPPESFFEGCVLDVCLGGQVKDILCQALADYAAACQAAGIKIEDWRTQAGCEITCPVNSHYELCGPPCPASCPPPARHTAPTACDGPCVEGCQCDKGFVLSADQCVPLDGGCGCWVNGTYYEAGTEFWADTTCSKRCHCGPGGDSLVCKPASCGLGEECALLASGEIGCQPISIAECQILGDPTYITLDGHRFDFQGTCEYLLSAPCHAPPTGTEYFNVTVVNEHRCSQAVSYTRSITLRIYGLSLTLSAHWPKNLLVDGEMVKLPFQLQSRLLVHLSGMGLVVHTSWGLSLTFDGNSFMRLRVPAAYAGTLCGLCGNYNKNPNDDLTAVGGKPEGWKVGGFPDCDQCQLRTCPKPCTPEERKRFGGPNACGIITAPEGPLAPCHSFVPPTQYFEACLLDTCQVQGHSGGLCPAIATYVAACQDARVRLREWRKPDFCPLQCPAHSHYQLCGDSCPVSCPSLSAPVGCETICREGCVCDAGFVLSGDTCVPVGQCGCLHQGRYYALGATFYPGYECEWFCECGPDDQVTCRIETCGIHEECRIEDGIRSCHPKSSKLMLVLHGTHYATPDGLVYDLYGSCSYILAQVCFPKHGEEAFSIVLEKDLAGNPQRVVVTVAGQVVVLAKGPQVTVDSEVVALPMVVGSIYITAENRNVFLQTKSGLKLLFDGDDHILISIPSPFRGRLCGLCGNFNGNQSDDFVLPSGVVAPNVEAFGAAWRAPGSSLGCGEGCGPQGCPVCSAEKRELYEENDACGKIRDPQGPFAACHKALNHSEYFHQCVFDLCTHHGDRDYLCRSLAAYTAACQAAGAAVKPWRTDSICPAECPAHSHYSICTHSCQGSCAAISGFTGCTTQCFEGCECDDHFLLSQGVCIPAQDCGCFYNDQYMPVDSSLMSSDCSERCFCSPNNGLTCHEAGCPSGRVCEIQAGVRGCWPAKGLCTFSVGGNLITFDGAFNPISSPGVYELSSRCPGLLKNVPWYRVLADVQPCHDNDKIVSKVHIFFQDGMVTVIPSKGTWVNGLRVDLPATVLTSVSVRRMPDGSMLVHQKAGVTVWLGKDGLLDVMVGDNHAAMLCGACGNFDGDRNNDVHKNQKTISIETWRAQDFSPCAN
ncbi:Fc fragment of IgG binding protein like 1 precursor [Mus musculus]|uniref:Mucin-2 n=1 Tax=Mus musculus TaxID=10090 RepID=E9PVG8_MOUSE|nr:Fc fragment of IgG binding protein like 1 precursor [Mus musculus]